MNLKKYLHWGKVFSLGIIFIINISFAETQKLIIESGDSSLSRQQAEMERDQWKDTRTLRQKQNAREEKEWDKKDAAIDDSYACQTSDNHQLYWEPKTRRCLDRSTGRAVKP